MLIGLQFVDFGRFYQAVIKCAGMGTFWRVTKKPIAAPYTKWPNGILGQDTANGGLAVFTVTDWFFPLVERVVNGFRSQAAFKCFRLIFLQPGFEFIEIREASFLS